MFAGSKLELQEFLKHFFESSSCCLGVSNGPYACCILTYRDKNFCSMSSFSGDSCVKRYQGACVCELICFGNWTIHSQRHWVTSNQRMLGDLYFELAMVTLALVVIFFLQSMAQSFIM